MIPSPWSSSQSLPMGLANNDINPEKIVGKDGTAVLIDFRVVPALWRALAASRHGGML